LDHGSNVDDGHVHHHDQLDQHQHTTDHLHEFHVDLDHLPDVLVHQHLDDVHLHDLDESHDNHFPSGHDHHHDDSPDPDHHHHDPAANDHHHVHDDLDHQHHDDHRDQHDHHHPATDVHHLHDHHAAAHHHDGPGEPPPRLQRRSRQRRHALAAESQVRGGFRRGRDRPGWGPGCHHHYWRHPGRGAQRRGPRARLSRCDGRRNRERQPARRAGRTRR